MVRVITVLIFPAALSRESNFRKALMIPPTFRSAIAKVLFSTAYGRMYLTLNDER
jgi:hypothetical protein